MRLRTLLSCCLVVLATGCVGPLQPLQPYAPLLRPLAPEPVCTDQTSTTVDAHGNVTKGPATAKCELAVPVPGARRR